MPDFTLATLYVDNPTASAEFYGEILGQKAVQGSPNFAVIKLSSGAGIGLRSRHTVDPSVTAVGVEGELVFAIDDVEAAHAEWTKRGRAIAQPPTQADFGLSFVGLDPDGHRLRFFSPATRRVPPNE